MTLKDYIFVFLLYYQLYLARASKHRGTQRLAVRWRPQWWRQTVNQKRYTLSYLH